MSEATHPSSKPMTATQINAIQEEALGLMRELNEYAQKHYRSQPRCTCDLMSICTRLYSALIKRLGSSSDETSGDWRPIETVPDPQITPVLGAVPRDASDFAVGEMHQTDAGWYWAGNDPSDSWGGQIYPTYWQPLPNPPGSAVKATAECRGCKEGWGRLGEWHWDSIGHVHECTAQNG